MNPLNGKIRPLTSKTAAIWGGIAVAAFHAAYWIRPLSWVIVFYLVGLFQISLTQTWRQAFYSELVVGLLSEVRILLRPGARQNNGEAESEAQT